MHIRSPHRLLPFAIALLVSTRLASAAGAETSLADAYRVLAGKRMVDLTHSFSPTIPVWSGFGQATFSAAADPKAREPYTIEKHGFRSTYYSLVGQYGTHVDPPAHFAANGRTMDEIPLTDMILPLVVIDETPFLASDPNHALSVADVEAWEKVHGTVAKGSFVALRTDMSKDWDSNRERFERYPFPAWSLDAVRFLIEQRGVTAIGHEALDTDTTEAMASETWLLQNGHYQIEALTNLDQVPATGAILVVTWPKVEKGTGFPARAFAILP